MANTPVDFPFQITTNLNLVWGGFLAGDSECAPTGAFADGTNRYYPLFDTVGLTVEMCYSTDTGSTWTNLDGTHSPTVTASYTSTVSNTLVSTNGLTQKITSTANPVVLSQQYIGACQDASLREIYVIYFNTSHFLTLSPFDTAVGTWGTAIVSGLKIPLESRPINSLSPFTGGLGVAYRGTDNTVVVALSGFSSNAHESREAYSATCVPTGTGWGGSYTSISGTSGDGFQYILQGVSDADSSGNFHFLYSSLNSGVGFLANATGTAFRGGTYTQITALNLVDGGTAYVDGTYSNVNVSLTPTPGSTATFSNAALGGSEDHFVFTAIVTGGVVALSTVNSTGLSPLEVYNIPGGCLVQAAVNIPGTNTTTLYHRAFGTSGLGPIQTLATATSSNDLLESRAGIRCINNNLYTAYITTDDTHGAGTIHVLRAVAGTAPTWEDLNPSAIQSDIGTSDSLFYLMDFAVTSGTDIAAFATDGDADFETVVYAYVTSPGIGTAWSTANIIGTIDVTGSFQTDERLVAMSFGSDLAISTPYGTAFSSGFPLGQGYWEITGTAPPVFRVVYIPSQYIKRHNAPGH